jgi:hypothetical protein
MLDPSLVLADHAWNTSLDSGLNALPTTQVAARMPAVSIETADIDVPACDNQDLRLS